MQTLQELMKQYNEILAREVKAQKYLDDNTKTIEEREKWIPEYRNILLELSGIFIDITKLGRKITPEEAANGFQI